LTEKEGLSFSVFSKKIIKNIYKWENLKEERKTEQRISLFIRKKEPRIMDVTTTRFSRILKIPQES
jgi:hypothetical protein